MLGHVHLEHAILAFGTDRAGVGIFWQCEATDKTAVAALEAMALLAAILALTALAGSGLLVAHFVPAWTERLAQLLEYPYYEGLSAFFQRAFTGLGQPVTVVSINTSGLLTPSLTKDVSVVNLMAPSYNFIERLLHGADLVLSENAISSIIGKAVCAEIPAAILRADDFDVFPAWDRDGVDRLGVFNDSSYAGTFDMLDMDDDSIEGAIMRLHALLTDETARESAIALGSVYASKVAELPWIEDIL
jgi:hypothetical protein